MNNPGQGAAMDIAMQPIGYVHAERRNSSDDFWGASEARIVLAPALSPESLMGLEDFSHAEVLFFFDQVDPAKIVLSARHPRNNPSWPCVGIFAQRGKNRPNRIGSTICRIVGRQDAALLVAELDAIDGTPVLDIKPVMRQFLPRGQVRQPPWVDELMRDYWSRGVP
jgi:tRNA (Thr-GGU) A37 N-methylase